MPKTRPAWTQAFIPSGARFRWPIAEGRALNLHLLEPLREMTAGHCAYCDGFPLLTQSLETIDHFQPKSQFRELAFAWANLFLVCSACNGWKSEHWNDLALRPDDIEFAFFHYFIVDFASGDIQPNPRASDDARGRAAATIELLGLNRGGRPHDRKRWLERQAPLSDEDLTDRPYRFLWELEPTVT